VPAGTKRERSVFGNSLRGARELSRHMNTYVHMIIFPRVAADYS
jgi:hypothetical protein